jgi:hypothetical protein
VDPDGIERGRRRLYDAARLVRPVTTIVDRGARVAAVSAE